MLQLTAKELSSVQKVCREGLSVLTSAQLADLAKYLAKPKKSFDNHIWDGNLVQAWRDVFRENPNVLNALESSIQDSNCTKSFYDVDNTFSQFDAFQEAEPINGLHYVNVRAACAVVKDMLHIERLHPVVVRTEEDVRAVCTNLKASAGAVNIGSSKEKSIKQCLTGALKIKSAIKQGKPFNEIQIPALVFHRAQISGFMSESGVYDPTGLKKKDRFVWGLDGATVTVEGQYAKPFIEHMSRVCDAYAGGKEPERLRTLVRRFRERKNYWTSTDYSKFDQTVPSWLIQWCFDQVKKCFDKQYWAELDWIAYNFINTKVAIPTKGVKVKLHGIPSGSNFTQVIGSMANAVMALSYVASLSGGKEFQEKVDYVRNFAGLGCQKRTVSMFVMGDDNLLFTQAPVDLEKFSAYVRQVFGVKINPSKCEFGSKFENPTFLKREWRRNGEYQDPCYLAVNTSHPERRRSYDGYSPWHILYGLYLTYRESFPSWVSERYLVEKMESTGGIHALERIPRSDLPGVFRAFGDSAIRSMVRRAESLLRVS